MTDINFFMNTFKHGFRDDRQSKVSWIDNICDTIVTRNTTYFSIILHILMAHTISEYYDWYLTQCVSLFFVFKPKLSYIVDELVQSRDIHDLTEHELQFIQHLTCQFSDDVIIDIDHADEILSDDETISSRI